MAGAAWPRLVLLAWALLQLHSVGSSAPDTTSETSTSTGSSSTGTSTGTTTGTTTGSSTTGSSTSSGTSGTSTGTESSTTSGTSSTTPHSTTETSSTTGTSGTETSSTTPHTTTETSSTPHTTTETTTETSTTQTTTTTTPAFTWCLYPLTAGQTEIEVDNEAGFAVGNLVEIAGGGRFEDRTIAGFGTIIFTEPLVNSYPAGSQIRVMSYTAPPTPAPAASLQGDPVTYYQGRKIEFGLPRGVYTPMLQMPDVSVFATPLQGEGMDQWIRCVAVSAADGVLLVKVCIKDDMPGFDRAALPAGSFETLDVAVGPNAESLEAMPSPDSVYHYGHLHFTFAQVRRPHRDAYYQFEPRREGILVTGQFAKVLIISSSAREFYGETHQSHKFAHLDLEFLDMRGQSSFFGVLAELWRIRPMSNLTRSLIKSEGECVSLC